MFVSQVFQNLMGAVTGSKKKKEKTTSFGVNLMTSHVLYLAAQVHPAMHGLSFFQPWFPLDALTMKLGV